MNIDVGARREGWQRGAIRSNQFERGNVQCFFLLPADPDR